MDKEYTKTYELWLKTTNEREKERMADRLDSLWLRMTPEERRSASTSTPTKNGKTNGDS